MLIAAAAFFSARISAPAIGQDKGNAIARRQTAKPIGTDHMQKVVEKPTPNKKPEKPSAGISAPKFCVLTVPLKNASGSPLVVHAFSAKSRAIMREAQELGSLGKKRRPKDPKDFDAVYEGARHISRDGWDGVTCASFRNAMISACRLVGFKMTVGKLSVFVEADGNSRTDGTPLVKINGEPEPFEAVVRNQTGVADIRVRPRWDEWSANLRVRYDREQMSDEDIVNLLVRAGAQCGIGEGRPDSSSSFGQGWGLFEIDTSIPISLTEIEAPKIQFVRA